MEAIVAFSEYALALCALLGSLLVPIVALYQVLRLKRRAVRVTVPIPASRGDRR